MKIYELFLTIVRGWEDTKNLYFSFFFLKHLKGIFHLIMDLMQVKYGIPKERKIYFIKIENNLSVIINFPNYRNQ